MDKIDVLTWIRDTGYRLSDLVAKLLPGDRRGLGWPEHKEPADLAADEQQSAEGPAQQRGGLDPGR
jgi:hypothetical protein